MKTLRYILILIIIGSTIYSCSNTRYIENQINDCLLYNSAIDYMISPENGVSSNQGLSYRYKLEKKNIYINSYYLSYDSISNSLVKSWFHTESDIKWVNDLGEKGIDLTHFYRKSSQNKYLCDSNVYTNEALYKEKNSIYKALKRDPHNAFIAFSNIFIDNNDRVVLFALWNTSSGEKVFLFFVFEKNKIITHRYELY